MQSKPWYASKTVWIGIVTALFGIVPLVVEFIRATAPEAGTIVTSIGALILGVLQIIRRVYLDGETAPAAIAMTPKANDNIGVG